MGYNAFLKLEGVTGECSDDRYRGWIDVVSFSHGVHRQGAADRVDHQDLSVIKYSDRCSPLLALACCEGRHFREARLVVARPEGAKTRFMEMVLTDVVISSYRPGGSVNGMDVRPVEEISLHYGKIEWIWVPAAFEPGREGEEVKTSWTV
jgi:type VI secretion system secreted protein Hcp